MRPNATHLFLAAFALASTLCAADLPRWTNIGAFGGWQYVAPDPVAPAHAWIVGQAGAAYQTLDGGATWTRSDVDPCPTPVGARMRNGILFVTCGDIGVMSTRDGLAWTLFSLPSPVFLLTVVPMPAEPQTAIAFGYADDPFGSGSSFVVDATQDGGRTWQRHDHAPVTIATFDSTARTNRIVGATIKFVDVGVQQLEIFESLSLGSTWRQIATVPVPANFVPAFPGSCAPQEIAADAGGALYLVTPCGLYVSRDAGANWTRVFELVQDRGPQRIRVDPVRAGHVALVNESFVMESFDGFATRTFSPGIGATITGADFTADGSVWVSTYLGAARYSQGQYKSLTPVERSAGGPVSAVLGANSEVLVTSWGYRSRDGGATWNPFSVNQYSAFGQLTYSLVTVPGQPLAAYAVVSNTPANPSDHSSRLLYSSDAAATWTEVSAATRLPGVGDVGFLSPVGPQPGVIYAATVGLSCSDCLYPASMVRSDDGGKSWRSIDAGLTGSQRQIRVTASNPALVHVANDSTVFRSSDSGATWQAIWGVTQHGRPEYFAVDQRDGATLYVRSGDRIFVSENAGASWREGAAFDVEDARILPDPFDAGRAFLIGTEARVFETKDRARSWRQVAMRDRFDPDNSVPPRVLSRGSSRSILANAGVTAYSVEVASPRFIIDTDLWWNPAQPGWGVSIAQHANGQMFVVWYTYDAQGKPTWRFIPGGTWTDAQTFSGDLFVARGPAYFGVPFAASRVSVTKVGTGTLSFADERAGSVAFALDDGSRFDSPFVRSAYGPLALATQVRFADLWWNPLESGWGISLHQQYGTMFATWFLYDNDGAPTWLVMPDAKAIAPTYYSGDVYSAAGAPAGPFIARDVKTSKVGTATINFSLGRATLGYTVNGSSASRIIERIPF